MISSQIIHIDLSQNQIMGKLPHQLVLPNVNFIDLVINASGVLSHFGLVM